MKIKKKNLVTVFIVIGIIILAGVIIYLKSSNAGEELVPRAIAECIGSQAIMYSQTGCIHCKEQKALFGSSVKYLNIIECDYQPAVCNALGITGTPTWIIDGEKYPRVQSIETLQNLTGC